MENYMGCYWHKNARKWRVFVYYQHQQVHIGYFEDEEEAAYIADQVALQLYDVDINFNILEMAP